MELLAILENIGERFASIGELVDAIQTDPDCVVIGMYPFIAALLVATRRNRRGARLLRLAARISGLLLRVVRVIVLLALGILLALARSEGRPHYRW